MYKIHLNGRSAEAVAQRMGGTLILENITDDVAMIAGGDPSKLEVAK